METFKELGVNQQLIKGLNELGIISPTEIQQKAIGSLFNERKDFVGQAQTGTGKTAAYGVPLLHYIDSNNKEIQALVLCPTRELCQQVAKQLFKFTKYTDKVFTEAVFGGEKIDIQIRNLSRPTQVVVATPGRLIDLLKKKALKLDAVQTIVLDEADEMLRRGFKDDMDQILSYTSLNRNTWLFSATMPSEIKMLIKKYLTADAEYVKVGRTGGVNKNITHQYVVCEEEDKLAVLLQFLKSMKGQRGIVFCKTKAATDKLFKQLQAKNINCGMLNGDMLQKERDKVMRAFKNESLSILVSTDVSARGIDVSGLAFVAHYQLPDQDEYYTHRAGRTGRAGEKGLSLCITTPKEAKQLKYLERALGVRFEQLKAKR